MGHVKSDIGRFAIIPEWLLLSGASPRAIQLFAVLACRYADRDGVAWPSRKRLAEDMGASLDTVDRVLKELCAIGAVVIERRKTEQGDRDSNMYLLRFAREVAAQAPLGSRTDADKGSRMDAATGSRTDAALTISSRNQSIFVEDKEWLISKGVEDSYIRADAKNCAARASDLSSSVIQRTSSLSHQAKPKHRGTTHSVPIAELVAEGVSHEDAEDWLLVRKQHRAPLTRAAWAQLKHEASKAGLSVAQAVHMCAANGWRGFRASWLAEPAKQQQRPRLITSGFATKDYGKGGFV